MPPHFTGVLDDVVVRNEREDDLQAQIKVGLEVATAVPCWMI